MAGSNQRGLHWLDSVRITGLVRIKSTLSHQPRCVSHVFSLYPNSLKPKLFRRPMHAEFLGSTSATMSCRSCAPSSLQTCGRNLDMASFISPWPQKLRLNMKPISCPFHRPSFPMTLGAEAEGEYSMTKSRVPFHLPWTILRKCSSVCERWSCGAVDLVWLGQPPTNWR